MKYIETRVAGEAENEFKYRREVSGKKMKKLLPQSVGESTNAIDSSIKQHSDSPKVYCSRAGVSFHL